jgi:anti-sigma regulatory factor (Ser/Thr protein kinase)
VNPSQTETNPTELDTSTVQQFFFTHCLESVGRARHWSERVVADNWQYDTATVETVALLVDELSANAVRHTPHVVDGTTRGFLVVLQSGPDTVRIEVHDAGTSLPLALKAMPDDESGRGLLLVDALSRDWGSHPRHPLGKVVWCEVACA